VKAGMRRQMAWAVAALLLGCSSGGDGSGTATGNDAVTTSGEGTTGTGSACLNPEQFADEPCHPLCPDESGCLEGQNCTFAPAGGFACLAGTQDLGMGCNDETFCAEGACVDIPEKGRRCVEFCVEDADCSDPETSCSLIVEYGGGQTIQVCAPKPPGCSVFSQNCEAAGQACYLAGETVCLAAGDKGLNQACTTPNDCVAGLVCVSDKCHEPCNPKTGGPDPKCHLKCPAETGTLDGVDDVAVCSLPDDEQPCDLLGQSDCPPGEACYFTGNGPRCRPEGSGETSAPCTQDEDCKKGGVCWPAGSTCKAVCDPTQGFHEECSNPVSPCSGLPGTAAGFCDE